jgi:FAD:protein FMN transferase
MSWRSAASTPGAPGEGPHVTRSVGSRCASFRAMGTEMFLIGPEGARAFDRTFAGVRAIFEREERRFSRFRPDSELSDVGRRAGTWTSVSAGFANLLALALDGAERSGGLFDPTILPALILAGYDRDFGELGRGSDRAARLRTVPARPETQTGRWREVRLRDHRVFLPRGVALDLGGIAKGWTADRALEGVDAWPWAVIDAGGDLRIAGAPPAGSLDVSVEDPIVPGTEAMRLKLSFGALATSSVTRRTWGPRLHHIIDPRTGMPAITRVLQATAWAETCAEAEVRATWALLAGPSVLDEFPAVVFLEGGEVRSNVVGIQARAG